MHGGLPIMGVFSKTRGAIALSALLAAHPVALADDGEITVMSQGAGYVTYFVDKTGVPTLTNRQESYRNNPDYEEVRVKLHPIVVPNRYKFGSTSVKYSASDIRYLVERYAGHYRLDPNLIYAVIRAESNFNPHAVSPAGARGLMQLMPATADEMRVNDIFDPAQNIAGGTQYLSRMLDMFDGDLSMALAGYNAGPGRVKEYGGVPPFKETKNYIARVQRFAKEFAGGAVAVQYEANGARPTREALPSKTSPIRLILQSGLVQPADSVSESATHYIVAVGNRRDAIRKDLVLRVEGAG